MRKLAPSHVMDDILKRIYQSTIKFLYPLEPDELYKTIVEEAIRLVNAKYGSLVLEQGEELKRVYTNMPAAGIFGFRKQGLTQKAFVEQTAFVKNVGERKDNRKSLKKLGIQSTLFIPLSNKNQSIGVLVINSSKDEEFNKEELEILKLFGSLASLAVRKTQLYAETKSALDARDMFMSMASHELRTPLTTINGYVQLLQSKLGNGNSSEARWVRELSWEVTRLTDLVNELLEVNRIKAGLFNYSFAEHSLKTIVLKAMNNFKFTHPYRKIVLDDQLRGKRDTVVADVEKLLQVITNLVDNAVKFSPESTQVVIKLSENKNCVRFAVIDHGAGIPRKDLPRIFEGFYRAQNHTREGMGVGLYLIKNIIDQHNGEIKVKSRLNKGTTFEISLPRVK